MVDHAVPYPAPQHTRAVPATGARSRRLYAILAWVFVAVIVIQVFLAGLAVFDSPAYWAWHVRFIHTFEVIPLIMVILAFSGRLPRQQRLLTVAAVLLVAAQHGILLLSQAVDLPAVSAVHTANALAIFGLAVRLAITRYTPAD